MCVCVCVCECVCVWVCPWREKSRRTRVKAKQKHQLPSPQLPAFTPSPWLLSPPLLQPPPPILFFSTAGTGRRARAGDAVHQTAAQDIVVATDRIFMLSRNLNGTAVVDFVKALCEVSMHDLTHYSPPRKYTLTKTVRLQLC